jgi:hypothetical protein
MTFLIYNKFHNSLTNKVFSTAKTLLVLPTTNHIYLKLNSSIGFLITKLMKAITYKLSFKRNSVILYSNKRINLNLVKVFVYNYNAFSDNRICPCVRAYGFIGSLGGTRQAEASFLSFLLF